MILNAWQRTVAGTYGGGDYGYLARQAEVFREDLADSGDTLFEFLMIELGDQEGCESIDEAIRRVSRAHDQLDDAIAALEGCGEIVPKNNG